MKGMPNIMSRRKPEDRKVMKFIAVVFALALAVLALPITTQAGSILHFRGNSADAFFQSFDSSRCIETDVFVSPPMTESKTRRAQGTRLHSSVCLSLSLTSARGRSRWLPTVLPRWQTRISRSAENSTQLR